MALCADLCFVDFGSGGKKLSGGQHIPSAGRERVLDLIVHGGNDISRAEGVNGACCDDPADADAAGLCEGREGFFAPNIWPDVEGFREAWTDYYRAMERLANELMALMARALGLEEVWFDDKIDQHISNLVVNHYPAQRTPPAEGQIRRGAHTDYGSLSILYQDDNPGGLQVQLRDGAWADIPHVPGSFVINLGDLMAAWTNDRWVSTMHSVVNPKPEFCDTSRMSVVFFHQPNYDAEISCIPTCTTADDPPHYEPVTSGQWVLDKLSKSVY